MDRILFPLALLVAACAGSPQEPPREVAAAPPQTAAPALEPGAPAAGHVQFRDSTGRLLCKLKARDDGFRFVGDKDEAMGEAKVQPDRVKLRDATDTERWKIKRKDNGAEIEDASGKRLFRLKGAGGEWKLEDAAEVVLAKSKPKDRGFELRDGQGKTLAKAKPHDGKVTLETESGERLGELEGTSDARAAQWFGLERFSLAERAALYAYFARVQP